jgi:hemoglobin
VKRRILIGLALAALAAPPAWAADDTLYRALGERAGLAAMMDRFVDALVADPRIGKQFEKTSRKHLSKQLTDQLCQVAGGPCIYDGPDMKTAHEQMDIHRADFNRLIELLQSTMDAQGVPFATQNRLLARLAPMHRDIITLP